MRAHSRTFGRMGEMHASVELREAHGLLALCASYPTYIRRSRLRLYNGKDLLLLSAHDLTHDLQLSRFSASRVLEARDSFLGASSGM